VNLVPLTRDEANAFIAKHHRHCGRVQGHRAAIGLEIDGGGLVGVAIIARPCRALQVDRFMVEVVRLCVAPGAPRGACSWLYARARRAAAALGFRRVTTMTLDRESGASLRGAGWALWAKRGPRAGWSAPSRPRRALPTDLTGKMRWITAC
jgi:hypothetical protein